MRHTLPLGSRIEFGNRQYIIRSVLGEGGSGIVYRVESVELNDDITPGIYALKEVFPADTYQFVFSRKEGSYTVICSDMHALDKAKKAAQKEYNLTRCVNNIAPSANDVLQILDKATLYEDEKRQIIENTFLLMRLPIGHTLSELLEEIHKVPDNRFPFRRGRFSSMQIRESLVIFRTLLVSLKSIHTGAFEHGLAQPLIHGDLKPENIWLSGLDFTDADTVNTASVLLLDFGSALSLNRQTMSVTIKRGEDHLTGTNGYVAWEAKNLDRVDFNLTPAYDLYSIGVAFTQSLCLFTNFDALYSVQPEKQNFKELDKKFYRQHRLENEAVVEELLSFIHRALANDPRIRFQSCEDMLQALDGLMDTVNNRGLTPSVLRKNIFQEVENYNKILPELLPPLRSEGKNEEERTTFANIEEALLKTDERYIQIIGNDGGSGKSSSIRFLQGQLLRSAPNNIPFLIDLKAYHSGDNDFMLREAVCKYAGKDNAALGDRIHYLENLIREKPDCRFFFLVDGVQDSSDFYADSVFEELERNSVYLEANVTAIVMTKTRLFNNDKRFASYALLPLPRENVWQVLREHGITTCEERVYSLCENPMLLSIALELGESGKSLADISTESDLFRGLYEHMCSMELLPDNKDFPLHIFRELKDFTIRTLVPELCFALYRVGVTVISSKQLEGVVSECLSSAIGNGVVSKSRLVWNNDFDYSVQETISILKRLGICEFNDNEIYIHTRNRDFLYCLRLKQRMETEKAEKWDDLTAGLLDDHISQLLAGLFRDHHTIVAWLNRRCAVRSTDGDEIRYRKQVATANMMRCLEVIKDSVESQLFSNVDFSLCDLTHLDFVDCQFDRCVLTNKIAEVINPTYTDISEKLNDFDICCGVKDNCVYLFSSVTGEVLSLFRAEAGVKWSSASVENSRFVVTGAKMVGHSSGKREFKPWICYIDPNSAEMQFLSSKEESLWGQYSDCTDLEDPDAKLFYLGEDTFLYSCRSFQGLHHYCLTWIDKTGKELNKQENVFSYQLTNRKTVIAQISEKELLFFDAIEKESLPIMVQDPIVHFHSDYYGDYLTIICTKNHCHILDIRERQWIAALDIQSEKTDCYYLPHTDSVFLVEDTLVENNISFIKNIRLLKGAYTLSKEKGGQRIHIEANAIIRYTPTGLLIADGRSVYVIREDSIYLLWEKKIGSFETTLPKNIFVPTELTVPQFVQNGWGKILYSDGSILSIDLVTASISILVKGNSKRIDRVVAVPSGGFLRIIHGVGSSKLELWDAALNLKDIMCISVPIWQTTIIKTKLIAVDMDMNMYQVTVSENGFGEIKKTSLVGEDQRLSSGRWLGDEYLSCEIMSTDHSRVIVCFIESKNTLTLVGVNDGVIVFRQRVVLNSSGHVSIEEDRITIRRIPKNNYDWGTVQKRLSTGGNFYVENKNGLPIEEASFEEIWRAGEKHAPELEMKMCSLPETISVEGASFFIKNGMSVIWNGESYAESEKLTVSNDGFRSWNEFRLPQDYHFCGAKEGIEIFRDHSMLVLRVRCETYSDALLVIKMEATEGGVLFSSFTMPVFGSSWSLCDNGYLLTLEGGNRLRKSMISFEKNEVNVCEELLDLPECIMVNCKITNCHLDGSIDEKYRSAFLHTGTVFDEKTIMTQSRQKQNYGIYKSNYLGKAVSITDKILSPGYRIQIPNVSMKVGDRFNLNGISEAIGMPLQQWKLRRENKNNATISGDTLTAVRPGVARITTNWYGQNLYTSVFVEGIVENAMEQLWCYIDDFRSSPERRWYMKNGEKFFIKEDLPSISLAGSKYVDHAYEKALKKIIADQPSHDGIFLIQNRFNIKTNSYYICGSVSPKTTFFAMHRENEIREQMLKSSIIQGVCLIDGERAHWLISFK